MDAENAFYPRRKYGQIVENRAIYSAAKTPFRWVWLALSNVCSWIVNFARPWLYAAPFGFAWGAFIACGADAGHSWFDSFIAWGGGATLLGGAGLVILRVISFILGEFF
ncbi:TPA: hypothetical protein QDA94_005329 [Burkholderia vietnamiensis]|jgi:hypothetical protein|uniref:Uncharacterized protein n=1 Tax=Burkholderia vietnamiensis TaxID=60552 RepID=A0AAW7SWQ5_BURVI|nr:hypothetical protein [Burkholderia vietnamiensis]MDN7795477.1 hypothetical protein [Burkholderia vietnamiensis]HDR8920153.1 hypothetical protein [Burkholderia vietnamiensis]HDR8940686.1 hypothetical protein [Burkholderia vietnamiensis]HDR8977925.1 hypothetical protein [Burkholderia vietnamiensis]HDR9051049.1 hypothetical protein [Burkholderia vietnamiensis]